MRLVAYIVNGEYPYGLRKSEKFAMRRASKSYSVKDGRLCKLFINVQAGNS